MDFESYQQKFQAILDDPAPAKPYDDAGYMNYVRLNWSREQRWLKHGELNTLLISAIERINKKQFWTIITEPWCGDAAHTLPFMQRIGSFNPLISIDYRLRDSEPFLIDQYLTKGTKSIPKLIIADEDHQDLATWGPRPAACQLLFEQLTNAHVDYAEKKIALQKWYNDDKGVSFQEELFAIITKIS